MLFRTCFTLLGVPFLPGKGPIHDGVRESSIGPDVSKHRHQCCPPVIDFSYFTAAAVVVVVVAVVVVVVIYRNIRTRLDLLSIPQSGEKCQIV